MHAKSFSLKKPERQAKLFLSIVVPCMNEEAALPLLVDRLLTATDNWAGRREIILVDDGSTGPRSAPPPTVNRTFAACNCLQTVVTRPR